MFFLLDDCRLSPQMEALFADKANAEACLGHPIGTSAPPRWLKTIVTATAPVAGDLNLAKRHRGQPILHRLAALIIQKRGPLPSLRIDDPMAHAELIAAFVQLYGPLWHRYVPTALAATAENFDVWCMGEEPLPPLLSQMLRLAVAIDGKPAQDMPLIQWLVQLLDLDADLVRANALLADLTAGGQIADTEEIDDEAEATVAAEAECIAEVQDAHLNDLIAAGDIDEHIRHGFTAIAEAEDARAEEDARSEAEDARAEAYAIAYINEAEATHLNDLIDGERVQRAIAAGHIDDHIRHGVAAIAEAEVMDDEYLTCLADDEIAIETSDDDVIQGKALMAGEPQADDDQADRSRFKARLKPKPTAKPAKPKRRRYTPAHGRLALGLALPAMLKGSPATPQALFGKQPGFDVRPFLMDLRQLLEDHGTAFAVADAFLKHIGAAARSNTDIIQMLNQLRAVLATFPKD